MKNRERGDMRKDRTEYDSLLDALVAIAKLLNDYESRYKMESEEFFDRYKKGESEDSEDFIEWANDCQHYLSIRGDLETKLQHVA
jgi:hypothetical protein